MSNKEKIEQIQLEAELRFLADHFAGKADQITIGEIEALVADVIEKLENLRFKGEKQMPEKPSDNDLWAEIKLLRFKNEGHEKMREWMQKEIDNYKTMQAEVDELSQLGELKEEAVKRLRTAR
jgi:hypothetical protein